MPAERQFGLVHPHESKVLFFHFPCFPEVKKRSKVKVRALYPQSMKQSTPKLIYFLGDLSHHLLPNNIYSFTLPTPIYNLNNLLWNPHPNPRIFLPANPLSKWMAGLQWRKGLRHWVMVEFNQTIRRARFAPGGWSSLFFGLDRTCLPAPATRHGYHELAYIHSTTTTTPGVGVREEGVRRGWII